MDPHTIEKLEFDVVRQILAEHVSCALGRSMAENIKPTRKTGLVHQWQTQLEQMIQTAGRRGLPPFGGVHDIREAIRVAVPPHCLEPEDFAVVAETLEATHGIVVWAGGVADEAAELKELCERIGDFETIALAIKKVIGPEGTVRDDASAKLKRIRREISEARISIGHVVDRILRDQNITKLLRYPSATFHNDRLVLPLAAEHRGRVPGIVHRSSDSGATVFVEPAGAVELNNRIIALKQDENNEITRLLMHLTHQIYLNQKEILKALEALAVLDLISAKVRFAGNYKLVVPRISDNGRLLLRQARHPLLERMKKQAAQRGEKREVVPIDVRLGDDFDLMVITGPNTGGKTAALKTVGLICLMAQAGLPIPAAEGSVVPVYSDILVDIGDEQSLQQSLSTFSAHLAWLLVMLKRARPNMLILIDELGAGTDPDEGAALGRAIVEELIRRRCASMVTTHLGVLKSVAFSQERAENACVDFDVKSLQPTYRLLIGEPGNSNAINIATRLGLPDNIIRSARSHLSQSHQQLNRAIQGTLQSRRQAERAREEAENAKMQAEKERIAAEQQLRDLQEQQARFQQWMEKIASLRPGDEVLVKRFDRMGKVVRIQLHRQTAVVNVGAMEIEVPLQELNVEPASA